MTHDPNGVFPLRGVDGITFAQRRAERDRKAAGDMAARKRRDDAARCVAAYQERERIAARPMARLKRWIMSLC